MSKLNRTLIALAVIASLAAPASAKNVCYFGECGPVGDQPQNQPHNQPRATPGDEPEYAHQNRRAAPQRTQQTPEDDVLRTIAKVGHWQVLQDREGDRYLFNQFGEEGSLAIAKVKGSFRIVLTYASWNFQQGQTLQASMVINGRTLTGEATALGGKTVMLDGLSQKLIQDMFSAADIKLHVDQSTWDFTMQDAARALEQADQQS